MRKDFGNDNNKLDYYLRDQGTYRTIVKRNFEGDVEGVFGSVCNRHDEYEDALIEALDAGMDSDEIADILLGSIS